MNPYDAESSEPHSSQDSAGTEYFEWENLISQQIYNNNRMLSQVYNNPYCVNLTRGGSVYGRKIVKRNREGAAVTLFNDYVAENPKNDAATFRRRFRMSKALFLRIVDAVANHKEYFKQQPDATNRLGLSTLLKITAVLRVLANDQAADTQNDYLNIAESTTVKCVKKYCRAVVKIFGPQYLRSPNADDIARLLDVGKKRGFPGMLGSLDCMHWKWKNCPTAWAGQYAGQSGSPSIILEAVADYDLWIWHAYFGMPGANNDINVLDRSPLFDDLNRGIAPPAHYVIQGKEYDMGYYLADNIYPKWSTLVQTIREPRSMKKIFFAKRQESCRKDVERAFGVLQSRFAIVASPARGWKKYDLADIMSACIIMHNMIIEDERDLSAPIQATIEVPTPRVDTTGTECDFQEYVARYRKIRDKDAHIALRNALIEHMWEEFSNAEE